MRGGGSDRRIAFLSTTCNGLVGPAAQDIGVRPFCHLDDPPYCLLRLLPVMSTEVHYVERMAAADMPATGISSCFGLPGVRAEDDLPGTMDQRIEAALNHALAAGCPA